MYCIVLHVHASCYMLDEPLDPQDNACRNIAILQKRAVINSVPWHYLEVHNQSTTCLQVWIIEAIPKNLSEAERFSRLCQHETFWIYTLDTLTPNSLNEELEINIT